MADGARGERWDLAWHKAGGAPVTSPQGLVVAAVHALRRRPGPIRAPHCRCQRFGSSQQLMPPRRVLWHTAEVVLLRFILREIEQAALVGSLGCTDRTCAGINICHRDAGNLLHQRTRTTAHRVSFGCRGPVQ